MDNNEIATGSTPPFGGQSGEPVPEVDPDDVKAVWRAYQDNPGVTGIGLRVLERVCKPGADVRAVYYRQAQLELLWLMAQPKGAPPKDAPPETQQQFSEFQAKITALRTDGAFRDAAFRAMAKVPMEWPGVGIVRDSHYLEEFLRLCNEP